MHRAPHAVALALTVVAAACAQNPALVVLDAKLEPRNAIAFANPNGPPVDLLSAFSVDHGDVVVDLARQTASTASFEPLPQQTELAHGVIARITRSGSIVWLDTAHADATVDCTADLANDDGALDADVVCAKGDFAGAPEGRSHIDVDTGALQPAPADSTCRLSPTLDVGDGTVIASLGSSLVRTTLDDNGCMANAMWTTDISTTPILALDPATMHIVDHRVLAVQQEDDFATFGAFDLDNGALLETHDASSRRALPAADGWFSLDAPFNNRHAPRLQHLDAHAKVIVDVAADSLALIGVDGGFTSAFVADTSGAETAAVVELPRG